MLKGVHTLVGNAVPPKLSYAIAKAIAEEEHEPMPKQYPRIEHDNNIEFVCCYRPKRFIMFRTEEPAQKHNKCTGM